MPTKSLPPTKTMLFTAVQSTTTLASRMKAADSAIVARCGEHCDARAKLLHKTLSPMSQRGFTVEHEPSRGTGSALVMVCKEPIRYHCEVFATWCKLRASRNGVRWFETIHDGLDELLLELVHSIGEWDT